MEPTPLAIISLTSPSPAHHLTKAMVEGTKGFLQIHPEVVSAALLGKDTKNAKSVSNCFISTLLKISGSFVFESRKLCVGCLISQLACMLE
jgi:hypothetical protein